MTTAVIYRVYDWRDELIYIGCTTNLGRRMYAHRAKSPWGPYYKRVSASKPVQFDLARRVERFAIERHRPPLNQHHNLAYWWHCSSPEQKQRLYDYNLSGVLAAYRRHARKAGAA